MKRRYAIEGTRWLALASLASGLGACSAQVESDYPGEPVASLHGTVATQAALELDDQTVAAIVWATQGDAESDFLPRYIGERVEVSDSFPASFTLDLFAPPPPEAEARASTAYCVEDDSSSAAGEPCDGTVVPAGTGVGLWMGYIVAVDADVPDGEIDREDIVGIDPDHVLVYYDHDKRAGFGGRPDEWATLSPEELAREFQLASVGYEPALDAGYHVLTYNPEYQALGRSGRECAWQELCVHFVRDDGFQDYADWAFQRCTEAFPDSPTCEARDWDNAEGEPVESAECRERYTESTRGCAWSTSESLYLEDAGLDAELTLELGLSFWDASW